MYEISEFFNKKRKDWGKSLSGHESEALTHWLTHKTMPDLVLKKPQEIQWCEDDNDELNMMIENYATRTKEPLLLVNRDHYILWIPVNMSEDIDYIIDGLKKSSVNHCLIFNQEVLEDINPYNNSKLRDNENVLNVVSFRSHANDFMIQKMWDYLMYF